MPFAFRAETLALRVDPPNIEIDNESIPDCTKLTIDSANRPGACDSRGVGWRDGEVDRDSCLALHACSYKQYGPGLDKASAMHVQGVLPASGSTIAAAKSLTSSLTHSLPALLVLL